MVEPELLPHSLWKRVLAKADELNIIRTATDDDWPISRRDGFELATVDVDSRPAVADELERDRGVRGKDDRS